MKLVRIAGILVVGLGIAAVAVLVTPSVQGQARRDRVDAQVAPQFEIFGAGSSIGVSVEEVAQSDLAKYKLSSPGGAIVESVREGTPASKAGLKAGDLVVEFDGERVRSAAQFGRLVRETPSGRTVKITVMRDGQKTTADITPESRDVWSSSFNFAPDIANMVREKVDKAMIEKGPNYSFFNFELPTVLNRGRLGITMQELNPQLAEFFGTKDGVLVTNVREGSPAATAGLKAGDVITAIGTRTVDQIADITRGLADARDGDLTIEVVRDKKEMTVKTKLEPIERRSPKRVFRMAY